MANNGDVALQHLSGTLDDAEISGGLRLKRGDPPSLTVDLSADRLALDSWLPARPATLAELYKESSGLDVDLRLNVRQALLAGVTIDGLVVDAASTPAAFCCVGPRAWLAARASRCPERWAMGAG